MNVRRLAFAAALLTLAAPHPRAAAAPPALRPCPPAAQQPAGALCGQIAVAVTLSAIAFVAIAIPSWRASRISPTVALNG
jgi:hypothetical protein